MEIIPGTPEADVLFAGMEDTLEGGAGNDTLDATAGDGGNLLLGQEDDDLLIAGSNDILEGGPGNDQLFGGTGGSTLTGGEGEDGLWIIDGALPEEMLDVTDFVQGTDVLGILGFTLEEVRDLRVEQIDADTMVTLDGVEIAILRNTVARTLTRRDFAIAPIPEVSLSLEPDSITEGESTTLTLSLSEPAPSGGLEVAWTEVDSDEALGDIEFLLEESTNIVEFEGLADGEVPTGAVVTIAGGATEATVVFSATEDEVEEGDETTTYTLEPGFGYTVDGENNTATLTISDPAGLVANDDEFRAEVDTPLVLAAADLLANDEIADGNPLEILEVGNASNGVVELVEDEITFTPTEGFLGQASFEYTASDTVEGTTDTATVTISVTNPAPGDPIPTAFELQNVDGTNGFIITGNEDLTQSRSGRPVSFAGDINGDGLFDMLVGADGADEVYVVFGDGSIGTEIDVTELDGTNGFTLSGADGLGESAHGAGDFNADGFDDIIVGAPSAIDSGAGQTYVIFGGQDFDANLDVTELGDRGVTIEGTETFENSGETAIGGGDYNDDGVSDIIIGAPSNNRVYVVFGGSSFSDTPFFALSDLLEENGGDGSAGFYAEGITATDDIGFSVGDIGDINADGIEDLAFSAIATGRFSAEPGQTYVVFGSEEFDANIDLSSLDGSNGFIFNGELADDEAGYDVNGAGDVNGDGIYDLVVSAPSVFDGNARNGEVYVIFGAPDIGDAGSLGVSDLDGSNGFTIRGRGSGGDDTGESVNSAGDFNNDGFYDIIIGVPQYDIPRDLTDEGEFNISAGAAYLIFGRDEFDATLELASIDAARGTVSEDGILFEGDGNINGNGATGQAGWSVSGVGDVNLDGVDDIIIGAPFANRAEGRAYVIFGFDGSQ